MLSEEALILTGALVVVALLVLGVLELLWPTRVQRPLPRPTLPPRLPEGAVTRLVAPPPTTRHPAFPAGSTRPAVATAVAPPSAAGTASKPPPVAATASKPPAVTDVATAEDDGSGPPTERCARLLAHGQHAEAAALAHAALAGAPRLAPADRAETARLWSLLARASRACGEAEAARRAMESAIGVAPPEAVPAYQQELVGLVVEAVPALLDDAALAAAAPTRLGMLREALAWIDVADAVGAVDRAVSELGVEVQAALWPAWEQVARELVQRQEFRAARRLLREGLGDPRLPNDRAEAFRTLLRRTFGGEVGQVTAQAVRNVQQAREADALGCLRRAERLLAAVDEDVLPPERREEVSRRVAWSYARLGARRLEAGDFEAALDALFQAVRFEDPGAGERPEARTGLVRALEGVIDARAAEIRRHVDTGDRDAALDASRRLWRVLETASERGVGEDVLGEVRGAAQRVTRELSEAVSRR